MSEYILEGDFCYRGDTLEEVIEKARAEGYIDIDSPNECFCIVKEECRDRVLYKGGFFETGVVVREYYWHQGRVVLERAPSAYPATASSTTPYRSNPLLTRPTSFR